jgi:hypothetical protein
MRTAGHLVTFASDASMSENGRTAAISGAYRRLPNASWLHFKWTEILQTLGAPRPEMTSSADPASNQTSF